VNGRPGRSLLVAALAAGMVAGCGSSPRPAQHDPSAPPGSPAAGRPGPRHAVGLGVVSTRSLPAPVQLPGLTRVGSTVLAAGGLDAADASVADVVRVAPGAPRRVGSLPAAVHDVGAAAVGGRLYVFGGGSAAGPTDAITAVSADGQTQPAGRLPVALSDAAAVADRGTAYVIGGYTTTAPLRSVLAFSPGHAPRPVATLPHPLRYAAAATVDGRVLVAGGTDGTAARDEILSIDPARHRVRVIGHLPAPLAHAAGVAIGGVFYVVGGRGNAGDSQRRGIWAVDPASGRVRPAGRLPLALSDLAAVSVGSRILVAGGRDAHGAVHRELLMLAPRTIAAGAAFAGLRPGRIPLLLNRHDVYAAERPGLLAPWVRGDPPRVYVPNSKSNTVDVIDQRTARIVDHFAVGALPQHVTPSWDLRTLWVTNDAGNSLTPIDPRTTRHGRAVPVLDPYNLYFTADGRRAIVVAEAHRELDFREPHSMRLLHALKVPQCDGVDHMDYTADGRFALVSCEFAGRTIVVDLRRERVVKTIDLRAGAMPQDVKLSPDGRTFYVADMMSGGVWLIDAHRLRKIGFVRTGRGAHGLYPSRDSRTLYVTNRDEGTISLISFRTRRPYGKWRIPGGGSPDMGGLSADGRVLWLSGRYNGVVYAISTITGRLLHRIAVGSGPHGLCVWPQPGRYSIGHTGILR
jgi:DNA-binding beta-propeller fold protein YncE